MPRRKTKLVDIKRAGFVLTEPLRLWLAKEYPAIDPDKTLEVFTDKALAKAWEYADWSAAFKNYIRRGNEFGGLVYKRGLSPRHNAMLERAKAIGFRPPRRGERVDGYRRELDEYDKRTARDQRELVLGKLKIKRIERDS